jgi:hypothetical protein
MTLPHLIEAGYTGVDARSDRGSSIASGAPRVIGPRVGNGRNRVDCLGSNRIEGQALSSGLVGVGYPVRA